MARGKASAVDISQQEAEIIARLDILAEYRGLGVRFASESPRSSGMIECYARERDERKPSAAVNIETGRYFDSASGENYSLWDFAQKYGGFTDWRAAREHFAAKAGVSLSSRKPKENPLDALEFLPWHAGHDALTSLWCRKHKRGASLEAIRLAGGRVAQYPCWTDQKTGERRKGEYKCIALPCFGDKLLAADPVAWVIWNISGGDLPVRRGKDLPADWVKMKSVGATRGTMMNLHALATLATPEKLAGVELIYKTGGPSDLLAVFASILRDSPERIDRHLVLTNASSETGDVLPHQARIFAGMKTILVHDADEAGEVGVVKWQQALQNVASELRCLRLPYQVQNSKGKDARDFLNGVPSDLASNLLAAS